MDQIKHAPYWLFGLAVGVLFGAVVTTTLIRRPYAIPVILPITHRSDMPIPSEPPLNVVDFEDMAGLDAATQELLSQRYTPQPPGDFEKRLRRLEWAVSALSDRVFGRSLLPGASGESGLIGDDGTGQTDPE
jgi:hypothetical protein